MLSEKFYKSYVSSLPNNFSSVSLELFVVLRTIELVSGNISWCGVQATTHFILFTDF